jgi:hypothetical protein
MAYVPQSLQISLVLQAFAHRLERALEVGPPSFHSHLDLYLYFHSRSDISHITPRTPRRADTL